MDDANSAAKRQFLTVNQGIVHSAFREILKVSVF